MDFRQGDRIGIKNPSAYPGVFPDCRTSKGAIATVEAVDNDQIICWVGKKKIAVDVNQICTPF